MASKASMSFISLRSPVPEIKKCQHLCVLMDAHAWPFIFNAYLDTW